MIKTGKELAVAACQVADNFKSLYVMGCFGAPLTSGNKSRYKNAQSYNRRGDRIEKIDAASADTFGFDCVGLIKSLLWGWSGDTDCSYGGALYGSNGVPDIDADAMIRVCNGVSTNFRDIQVGEVVWVSGHIGIYVGNAEVIECTPNWADGVQHTVLANIACSPGKHMRTWTKHGRLPYITYAAQNDPAPKPAPESVPGYSVDDFVRDIQNIAGISIDGDPGTDTLNSTVTISMNTNRTHKMVLPIQRRLHALGFYNAGFDGKAGPGFDQAVRDYQCYLETGYVDGEITAGRSTWRALLGRND